MFWWTLELDETQNGDYKVSTYLENMQINAGLVSNQNYGPNRFD